MPEFLAAVGARLGIISAGEQNPYGHPSPVLLERLEESAMRVLRTGRRFGRVVMWSVGSVGSWRLKAKNTSLAAFG
jgi:competence protein ComEC